MSVSAPVTVLLPVHNGARWLPQAIDSVLAQTFSDFELLVVDDGSGDATGEVLAAVSDPRLRVLRHATNQGIVVSLNHGLEAARGELIARMDADDVCRPDRLARQVAVLERQQEVGIVGGAIQQVDTAGTPIAAPVLGLPTRPAHIRWLLWWHNVVNHPTVLARRSVLSTLDGYDPAAFPAEDYDLWLRAAELTQLANVAEVVLDYREHGGNVSRLRAAEATQRALCAAVSAQGRALGRSVPVEAVALIREPHRLRHDSAAPVRAALASLRDLTAVWQATAAPQAADRALVEADAASWVASLALAALPAHPARAGAVLRHRAALPAAAVGRAVVQGVAQRARRRLPRRRP